jgi:hypothetical protein
MGRKRVNKNQAIDVEYTPSGDLETVAQDTLDAFKVVEPEVIDAEITEDAPAPERDIITGVVLKKCPVVMWNPGLNVIVYNRDGQLIQTNTIDYHGEGYVEVE